MYDVHRSKGTCLYIVYIYMAIEPVVYRGSGAAPDTGQYIMGLSVAPCAKGIHF